MDSENTRTLRDMAYTAEVALTHANDFRDELAAIQARAACLQALGLERIATVLERQFTPDAHIDEVSMVKGAIIGALTGGHMDSKDGASYSKAVLANIADILGIEIPANIKAANGLH